MGIRVKIHPALWCGGALCAVIAAFALLKAFPALWPWLGDNSSNIASWVQAIGSIVAILAGFYVAERTIKIQNNQQMERDKESKRIKDRMQFYVIADLLEAAEAWGEHILSLMKENKGFNIESSILIGQSVITSVRSVPLDQIPAVEVIRRINLVVLGAESLLAALKVARDVKGSEMDSCLATIELRAAKLKKCACVDKEYCSSEGLKISTSEESSKRNETTVARNRALDEILDD